MKSTFLGKALLAAATGVVTGSLLLAGCSGEKTTSEKKDAAEKSSCGGKDGCGSKDGESTSCKASCSAKEEEKK